MRVDEKQVDGPDLQRDVEQQETLLAERHEAELPEIAGDQRRDHDHDRSGDLLAAIQLIFERKQLNVTHLRLPQREAIALEALQAAVHGRLTNLGTFVYASDRRSMLEQALAVLQPNLSGRDPVLASELREAFADLSKQVGELRTELGNLEDAQEDVIGEQEQFAKAAATGGADDEPADPDAPRPASTLSGPERPAPAKRPTTLAGPEVVQERAPSTLAGPELRAEPTRATTLGSADDLASAPNKPWWRGPVGRE